VADHRILLRVEDAAKALDISRAHLYTLLTEGAIPSIRIGRSRRIPRTELEKWVAQQLEGGDRGN